MFNGKLRWKLYVEVNHPYVKIRNRAEPRERERGKKEPNTLTPRVSNFDLLSSLKRNKSRQAPSQGALEEPLVFYILSFKVGLNKYLLNEWITRA